MQQERALDFLAQAAGDERDDDEEARVAWRLHQILQRVVLDVVQRRHELLDDRQYDAGDADRHEDERQARDRFAHDAPTAEKHVARPLAVGSQKQQHEPDDRDAVGKRHRDDVSDAERVLRRLGGEPQDAQRRAERDLRRIAGTQKHFHQRDDARGGGGTF